MFELNDRECEIVLRCETDADIPFIRQVHQAAFPTGAEADLVDALRSNGNLIVSLVACRDDQVIGHIAFSPVSVDGQNANGLGLAPVAVLPMHQRSGYGSALIRAGLDACRAAGVEFVVVLGEPRFYAQFGFATASRMGFQNEYRAGDEFMAIALREGSPDDVSGLVRYGDEFRALG